MSSEIIHSLGLEMWHIYVLIVIVGVMQGFVNTIAGAGTSLMFALLSGFGMPVNMINGTVRLGILMQTGASSIKFYRNRKLALRKGLILAIPMIVGSIAGAELAININSDIFEKIVGVVLLGMLVLMYYDPKKWIEGQSVARQQKTGFIQILIFTAIGFYGGFLHIGVGIFLLSALVLNAGFDLVQANALKVFLVLTYAPVVFLIYLLSGEMDILIAVFAGVGNTIGGILGTEVAIKKGAKFIRGFLVVVVIAFSFHLLGIWKLIVALF